MKLDSILAGIAILRKYTSDAYPLGAEHDEISFNTTERVSDDDVSKLYELGWWFSDDGEDDSGNVIPGDPDDGYWGAFV